MCGISGITVTQTVTDYEIAKLTARIVRYLAASGCGQDSSGLATKNGNGRMLAVKSLGLIDADKTIAELPACFEHAATVIGHTRHATRGAITIRNAHPIISEDGTMAIVHNGVLLDPAASQHRLEEKGHRFATQTDSEILLHELEDALAQTDTITPERVAEAAAKVCSSALMANAIFILPDNTLAAYSDGRLYKRENENSVMIATIPATKDSTAWRHLPRRTVVIAKDGRKLFQKNYRSEHQLSAPAIRAFDDLFAGLFRSPEIQDDPESHPDDPGESAGHFDESDDWKSENGKAELDPWNEG